MKKYCENVVRYLVGIECFKF